MSFDDIRPDHEAVMHEQRSTVAAATSSQRSKYRENLFGRADLAACYRRAKDLIVEHKLFRLVQCEISDGTTRVTICNVWRLERCPDSSLILSEFDLNASVWKPTDDVGFWPDIPLWPITEKSLTWWRSVAADVIWKALVAAGYLDLPTHLTSIEWDSDPGTEGRGIKPKPGTGQPDLHRRGMAARLIERYVGKPPGSSRKARDGFLKPESMRAGARALRAAIWQHVVERELFSATLSMNGYFQRMGLRQYLYVAKHRKAVLRVASEHRNLLPLLHRINPEFWGRNDLFSRRIWVRDGRRRTVADYRRFGSASRCAQSPGSFESPAAWRWLLKASSTVILAWSQAAYQGNIFVENIVRAGMTARLPAVAWVQLVKSSRQIEHFGIDDRIQRLYRLWAIEHSAIWKQQGLVRLRATLAVPTILDVLDWLRAEGFQAGLPDKNSTWSSLVRRSQDWHERAREQTWQRTRRKLSWTCCVGEMEIGGVLFQSLLSSEALLTEGGELRHCIGSYDVICSEGRYRAFRVISPCGTRSTLGLHRVRGTWAIEQHRGKYNGAIPETATKAAVAFLAEFKKAYRDSEHQEEAAS